MQTKHTAGPWHVTIYTESNTVIAREIYGAFAGEAAANALLVAAAPDLLAALELLLAHRECPIHSPEAAAARIAISRAKGA